MKIGDRVYWSAGGGARLVGTITGFHHSTGRSKAVVEWDEFDQPNHILPRNLELITVLDLILEAIDK